MRTAKGPDVSDGRNGSLTSRISQMPKAGNRTRSRLRPTWAGEWQFGGLAEAPRYWVRYTVNKPRLVNAILFASAALRELASHDHGYDDDAEGRSRV